MMEVPVLIVGGGPVGLTASHPALAARRPLAAGRAPPRHGHPSQGARHQRPHHGDVPPAAASRPAIRAAGLPPERTGLIVWTRDARRRGDRAPRALARRAAQSRRSAPVRNCLCAQDDLEPVLRRFAEEPPPGELRFNTELTAFSRTPPASPPPSRDRVTRRRAHRCGAQYLIAADGAQSRDARARSASRMSGEEDVYDSVNILFDADLTAVDGASPGRALLRRAAEAARHLPHHQRASTAGASWSTA